MQITEQLRLRMAADRAWMTEHIRIAASRRQMLTAIDWLERQGEEIAELRLSGVEHPGITYSHVIHGLLERLRAGDQAARRCLFAWLAEDWQGPFGLILYKRALRTFAQMSATITSEEIEILETLLHRQRTMVFPPREAAYLAKLLQQLRGPSGSAER